MAITFVGRGATESVISGTGASVPVPTIAANDLLISFHAIANGAATNSTVPYGWPLITGYPFADSNNDNILYAY